MAEEFKIKTSIELDDKKARKQLASLKTSAKENNIKLNVEMNASSLNNLKQLENTLKQINKLSRETQNGLFGGKGNSNGNINKLTSQYDNFRKKIESTQRQLKKFTQTNILDNKQIGEINKLSGELKRLSNIKLGGLNSKALSDLSNVQSKLANMKIPDMNTKMASQF
ncbi:TPA: phage tail tape measure protein, partial [Clostridioides difficile]